MSQKHPPLPKPLSPREAPRFRKAVPRLATHHRTEATVRERRPVREPKSVMGARESVLDVSEAWIDSLKTNPPSRAPDGPPELPGVTLRVPPLPGQSSD